MCRGGLTTLVRDSGEPAAWQVAQSRGVPLKTPLTWHDSQRSLACTPMSGKPGLHVVEVAQVGLRRGERGKGHQRAGHQPACGPRPRAAVVKVWLSWEHPRWLRQAHAVGDAFPRLRHVALLTAQAEVAVVAGRLGGGTRCSCCPPTRCACRAVRAGCVQALARHLGVCAIELVGRCAGCGSKVQLTQSRGAVAALALHTEPELVFVVRLVGSCSSPLLASL